MEKCPAWVFTGIVLAIILWLTLAPHPLGDEEIPLFPGADKLIHAIMFGTLSAVLLFDWSRAHLWKAVPWSLSIIFSLLAAATGIAIEFAQNAMGLGRSLEVWDMIADTLGAIVAMLLWKWAEATRPSKN